MVIHFTHFLILCSGNNGIPGIIIANNLNVLKMIQFIFLIGGEEKPTTRNSIPSRYFLSSVWPLVKKLPTCAAGIKQHVPIYLKIIVVFNRMVGIVMFLL